MYKCVNKGKRVRQKDKCWFLATHFYLSGICLALHFSHRRYHFQIGAPKEIKIKAKNQ